MIDTRLDVVSVITEIPFDSKEQKKRPLPLPPSQSVKTLKGHGGVAAVVVVVVVV